MKATQESRQTTAELDDRRCRGRPQLRSDDETRAIIFEVARHQFIEKGFAATSMETVARGAGISTRTLYRLVPNKTALFEAMLTARMDRFLEQVSLQTCEHQDVEMALRAALTVCAEMMFDEEVIALQRVMLAEGDRVPEMAETFYQKAMRRSVAALADWLRARRQRSLIEFDDAEEAAGILIGMLAFAPQRAALFGHQPLPTREATEKRVCTCASLFLHGCAV
ncbi:TetR/AcrR family transcriptional regulator [Bradyrhizobium sp. U87765 SZCCT0131]|nr:MULTISPECIES: TetR/AcrR family transcriptional regulator [unclassified Bradyrhizobium]MBR1306469.1 TetR/AcrR family transcriptional regulator [Bradyrhizobium sp. U87765 SZCCT0110]MBR1317460.1 TetR/AcrR family transcriptional regulator [Bradyrhizobium sp. U87765 SZCCT0109]MBR1219027.1 TetR/AcrR family transcriptional regulator [Bradyrhizobium sp. U87765 SZCCT0131]MBR1261678.1 TetR/AcrR family transcriptional regulator [Bradyrhizobium sp. U87765 SZCCT0134]MBR1351162.1 TetR/AcrR family transcr